MRVKVLSPEFAMATKRAAKFVAKRTTLPVTNNTMLQATIDNEMWLTSTDLETTLCQRIQANVDEPGAITLPAAILADTAGRADAEITEITTIDGEYSATITGGRQSSKISGIDAEDFPPVPGHFNMATAIIDAQQFASAAKQVASMAEKKHDWRPALQCVNFELTQNKLMLTASDGFRLGIRNLGAFENSIGQASFMVNAESITKLVALIPKQSKHSEALVYVALSRSHVAFSIDDCMVICCLSNAKAPNYGQIIPDHADTDIVVNRAEFLQAVKVCNTFAKLDSGIIRLAALPSDPNTLAISAKSEAFGEVAGRIPAAVVFQGLPPVKYISDNLSEPLTGLPKADIAFNGAYLVSYLAKLTADRLCLGLTTPDMAALFTPMDGQSMDTDNQTVIMPMSAKNGRDPLPDFNAWTAEPEPEPVPMVSELPVSSQPATRAGEFHETALCRKCLHFDSCEGFPEVCNEKATTCSRYAQETIETAPGAVC